MKRSHVFGGETSDHGTISPWQHVARSITMNAAMKIAQGFSCYRQRFGTCQTSVFSLQQGGTAFLALMCNIQVSKESERRNLVLQHLYMLMEQLQEMAQIYDPAKVMCSVVKHEMEQLGIDFNELPTPPHTPESRVSTSPTTLTQRDNNEHSIDSAPPAKRRRLSPGYDDSFAINSPPLNPGLNQNMDLPNITPPDQFGAIGCDRSAPSFLDVIDGQLPMTVAGNNSEELCSMPYSISDFNMVSSWPMDFSETSALFDGQNNEHISSDILVSFLPVGNFFK
jgi:hypothetical protein